MCRNAGSYEAVSPLQTNQSGGGSRFAPCNRDASGPGGANVGRSGFLWSGDAYIGRKAEWPVWTPPREMIRRQPEVAQYAGGMPPGLGNPLGARTLYLYQNGAYTLYTIYSTIQPETIGKGVSSGCVGLLTQDMFDLYAKTPVDTKVVVLKA